MRERIREAINQSISAKQAILANDGLMQTIEAVVEACVSAFIQDGKILFCGNGGSAADAQHLAAEFSGRFYFDRPPLFAEALHVNTSFITAVANDYDFNEIYARMVRAAGRQGDLLFCLSTSGNSPNILKAALAAREQGMIVVGMTGSKGGQLRPQCDFLFDAPSDDTPRIQECHMLIGHIICELVEQRMFT
ncbi:MAG: SIS domain-containing protein [Phaeodactylibacter sp.]|nr:SIS domain-containing protein [Phaeodactylibacter sp.]MCB9301642.1 SIS domain-containing protein [Lewinellaceae bacterium]